MQEEDFGGEEGRGLQTNQSITMSTRILAELANSVGPLGVSEIARRIGGTKARVFRHLATMKQCGLVSQESAGEDYSLGWNIYRLGVAAAEQFGLVRVGIRHMTLLRDSVQETVALAIPANGDALVVGSVQSEQPISISVKHGVVTPSYASAMGRVILAFTPEEVQTRYLAKLQKRAAPSGKALAITSAEALQERLKFARANWWEVSFNENVHGIAAVAAPVFDAQGRILAAVAVVGSAFSLTSSPDAQIIQSVQRCAAHISTEFNSDAWLARQVELAPEV